MWTAGCDEHQRQTPSNPLTNLDGSSPLGIAVKSHLTRRQPCSAVFVQLESSCASHVRTRTTPLRHCSSSATTAAGLRSVVPLAPDRSSAIRDRSHPRRLHTSPYAARAAVEPLITSPERLSPKVFAQNLPSSAVAGGIVRHADEYPAMRQPQLLSLAYGRCFTDCPAGEED